MEILDAARMALLWGRVAGVALAEIPRAVFLSAAMRVRIMRQRQYKNENDVKRHVKELLDKHGWHHWANAAGPFSVGGLSDRMGLKRGMFIAVECKGPSGNTTPLQRAFLSGVEKYGGKTWVVTPKNIAEFEAWLRLYSADEEFAKP
jgi:hypothetical protein